MFRLPFCKACQHKFWASNNELRLVLRYILTVFVSDSNYAHNSAQCTHKQYRCEIFKVKCSGNAVYWKLSRPYWHVGTLHIMMEEGFRFSACVSYASGMWSSYGPYMTRIGRWSNPSIISCWDRGPRDPRGVPWDQIFNYHPLMNLFYGTKNCLF